MIELDLAGPERAPPVVLAPALGASARMWAPQLPALRDRYRVAVYEHTPRASVSELAEELVRALDRIGLEQVSFCGLSLGAMVGMWIAASRPRRISRLVLACTAARLGTPTEWRKRAALVRAEGMGVVAHDALAKWFTPAYRDREPFLRMQLAMPAEDYALGLEAIASFDFRSRLHEVRAPTLVIAGADDSATTPADAAAIADGIAGARLLVLKGAAHLANVEQAAAFTAAVIGHLERRER